VHFLPPANLPGQQSRRSLFHTYEKAPPLLSISYAVIGILIVDLHLPEDVEMLPFVAPHAIVIGQAEGWASKAHAARGRATVVQRHRGKILLRRALNSLAKARMRKADLEIAVHRGLNGVDRRE
jgi:hypothetical protein